MKHLEEAREESSINSSREGEDDVLAMQTDPDSPQGNNIDGNYFSKQNESVPDYKSNNNTMIIPVVGFVNPKNNDSNSSLSSIEHTDYPMRASANSRQQLSPVDHAHTDRSPNPSLASIRLPPIASQPSDLNKIVRSSEKIDSSSLSSPEKEKPDMSRYDGNISPRAPIYVMSEDSDLYDSNMEVDREPSKVFTPVEGHPEQRSFSPLSSSDDEEESRKSFFKKPPHKSESKRAKSSKSKPKGTASVSPKPGQKLEKQAANKLVKPGDTRWASPTFSAAKKGHEEIKLQGTPKEDDKNRNYQMQSYV